MARPENRLAGLAPLRGASGDSTRRHNLSTLLRIIHSDGAVSRSDLTKLSGLNRSTVLGLVAELIEIGAVLEHEPEATRKVGRPSPVVSPATDLVAIAVNPDADAVTIALVDFAGTVLSRQRHETAAPPTVAETVDTVTTTVEGMLRTLDARHRVLGIGVALPGLVRTEDSLARIVPHLGWTDVALGPVLSQSTGLPVWADNDANLAVQAELTFGAGRGRTDIVYLNGGRGGIGGGVIVNGALLRGSGGYTGEFGHNAVPAAPPPTGATAALSGDDLENLMSRQMLLDALGLPSADERTFETALLTSDSAEVAAEVDRQLAILSVALRNAINVLNPELILLGGYLSALQARNPDLLDSLVRAQTMAASVESLSIERAALGADLLMIGAAELVFAPVLADPAGTLARQSQASPLH